MGYSTRFHFADDLACELTRFAVLFDDEKHSVIAGDRPQLLEPRDPHAAVVAARMAKRQHLPDTGGCGLLNPIGKYLDPFGIFGVNT